MNFECISYRECGRDASWVEKLGKSRKVENAWIKKLWRTKENENNEYLLQDISGETLNSHLFCGSGNQEELKKSELKVGKEDLRNFLGNKTFLRNLWSSRKSKKKKERFYRGSESLRILRHGVSQLLHRAIFRALEIRTHVQKKI